MITLMFSLILGYFSHVPIANPVHVEHLPAITRNVPTAHPVHAHHL
jgi:hypothetical protein